MAIHKLANGPITLTIASIQNTEGNFGPQVCFNGDNDVAVFISELSATKQLARINLTAESAIGQTLHFEQIKKDGKTYTNILLAGEGTTEATPAPVAHLAVPVAPKAPVDLAALAVLYSECFSIAMATLGVKCEEAGVPYDAAALQAAAATIFIKATR